MAEIKELEIELETKSPFRIGSKKLFAGIEQPIVKIGGRIVVPGTSLKGALRQEIESYLIKNFSDEPEMKPCIPASRLSADEKELVLSNKYRRSSCHYPCKMRKEKGTERCDRVREGMDYFGIESEKREGKHSICPVCYLLGGQGIPGFIGVPFLNTETKEEEFSSVRIDRARRTVAEEGPRSYSVIPEGAKFRGVMQILLKDGIRGLELGEPRSFKEPTLGDKWLENSNWTQEKIIKELVKERLEAINVLGGLKSTGAGKVEIRVTEKNP